MSQQDSQKPNNADARVEQYADLPSVDDAVITEILQIGGREFVAKMVAQFVSDATACVEQVMLAVEREDPKQLAEAGHGLKGICANLGVKRLQQFAFEAEQLGRKNHLEGARELSLQVQTELAAVCEQLKTQHVSTH